MGNMLYNGVELPDINAVWDKETYPFVVLNVADATSFGFSGQYVYRLLFTSVEMTRENDGLTFDPPSISTGSYANYFYADSAALANFVVANTSFGACGYDGVWAAGESKNTSITVEFLDAFGQVPTWSNYNVLYTSNSTVYLAASEPVDPNATSHITTSSGNGFALYNGVKLPKLPEWDKETYPYVAIGNAEREDMPYILITSTVPFVIQNERLTVPLGNAAELYAQMTALNTKWIFAQKLTNNSSSIGYAPVAKSKTVWCNYNIIDEDNSVFLAASDPIPLDGYTVIEWDGNTEGLEAMNGMYFLVSDSVPDVSAGDAIIVALASNISDCPRAFTDTLVEEDGYLMDSCQLGQAVVVLGSDVLGTGVAFVRLDLYEQYVYTSLFAYKADSGGGGGGTDPNPPDSGDDETGSGHYGMVEGAIHEIIGGTARVNGAGCEIADGRARTGGAWYELNFGGTQSGEGGDIGDDTELNTGVLFEGGIAAAPIQYQVVNATNAAIGISPSAGIEDDYIFTNCGEGQINAMYPPIPIVAQIGPVDLSGYSTLHMTVSANGHVNFGYGNTLATKNSPNLTDYVTGTNVSINTKAELTVDIGSVSGEQYIKFYAAGTNTTARAYKIWLT